MDKIARLDAAISKLLRVLVIQERHISSNIAAVPFNLLDLETLLFLSQHEGAQAKEIATYLRVSATTMQSVIDRLAKRGFIVKNRTSLRGRAVAIVLTLSGIQFLEQMHLHNIQNCEKMLAVLDPVDQEIFVENLSKIAAGFSNLV